jgi:hypothetical protein
MKYTEKPFRKEENMIQHTAEIVKKTNVFLDKKYKQNKLQYSNFTSGQISQLHKLVMDT